MDEYIVSARKYRPMTFDSVVGQSALTTTLKNTVKSGKLAHAYLFCGPRGVGKTTCARIFAKTINCEHPSANGEACNQCESCRAFNENRSYNVFELDAASNNSIDDIRSLMEQTRIPPQIGRYKVFIIDEVHMLSTQAFNAFLKTLEEPPAHVIFILATTEKHKILPTIISRCQIYDFERMSVTNIVNHLKMVAEKEGIAYEEQALGVIAEKADGGMRDALSIFDQVASFSQGNITYKNTIEDLNVLDVDNYFKIVDWALDNKVSDIMVLLNGLIKKGFDGGRLIVGLASHVRNVMMAKDANTVNLLEISEQQRQRYQEQAQRCTTPFIYKALQILNRCDICYNTSNNKRLLVELTLIEVAQITQEDDDSPAAGRSPKRLKSLFKNIVRNVQPKAAPQVAAAEAPLANSRPSAKQSAQTVVSPTPTLSDSKAASATPSETTSPRKHLKSSKIGFSWKNLEEEENKTKKLLQQETEITNKDEETAFTQDDLEIQWRAMCTRMKKSAPGIAPRLNNIRPTITDYPNIEIVVQNQILLDNITPIQSRLRATMAKFLHNGNIQLVIRLAKQEELQPVLSRRELYDKVLENNIGLRVLASELKLEMS